MNRASRTGRRAAAVRRGRRIVAWLRHRVFPSDGFALAGLLVAVTACGLLSDLNADWFPATAPVLPILVGGLVLRMPSLLLLYAATAGVLVAQDRVHDPDEVTVGTVLVVAAVAGIVLLMARMRTRLGVQWTRGESMLFDLRDRLRAQGEMPVLPPQWHTEVVLRPAGGQSFSGDFLVAARSSTGGRMLEVVLVDVSGKGLAAGTRALMLSGAFGGLLGSLPPHGFLPAANDYLLRQEWAEGFATAVHVVLDLESGEYELLSAGHPPGVHWIAETGRWRVVEAAGPLLGVLDDATFEGVRGRLDHGDALLLFTDGMVELPGEDIATGIDRFLGEAERLVRDDFHDAARRIVAAAGRNVGDDRAVVLLRRR
ncbi:PP2C family protein-serine/threonine phosphatase [Embleya scabrispora]|uniref:PP2C family protein-serine/threonine phosphatase n=1 Tax=Embleya scabrispora TaxID=159449 RepID=UPI001911C779|nr:PP2C family protein-serine/threonine phosphatase [Embleya scabrispora]